MNTKKDIKDGIQNFCRMTLNMISLVNRYCSYKYTEFDINNKTDELSYKQNT